MLSIVIFGRKLLGESIVGSPPKSASYDAVGVIVLYLNDFRFDQQAKPKRWDWKKAMC